MKCLATIFCAVLCTLTWTLDAEAQRRNVRKTSPKRTPRPVASIVYPANTDPTIISTAAEMSEEDNSNAANVVKPNVAPKSPVNEEENAVRQLSQQVETLNKKISALESQQKSLVDLEKLTRAEQRAETLRARLVSTNEKITELEMRRRQIEIDLQPTNIERTVAVVGTTRPEEVRAARQTALEKEMEAVNAQLQVLTDSRSKTETSLQNADRLVEKLQKTVDANEAETASEQTPPQ